MDGWREREKGGVSTCTFVPVSSTKASKVSASGVPGSVSAYLRTYETHALKEAVGRACAAARRANSDDALPCRNQ